MRIVGQKLQIQISKLELSILISLFSSCLFLVALTTAHSDYLGNVTSLIPGLIASESKIQISHSVNTQNLIRYSSKSFSIHSLGTFGKALHETAESSVIVFGLVLQ